MQAREFGRLTRRNEKEGKTAGWCTSVCTQYQVLLSLLAEGMCRDVKTKTTRNGWANLLQYLPRFVILILY